MVTREGPPTKKKRPVGAGLSLDKFASAGVSKYDKRKVLERLRKEKVIKRSKYSKLKHKLEAQGALKPLQVKDSVAELEQLDHPQSEDAGPGPNSTATAGGGASEAVAASGGVKRQRHGDGGHDGHRHDNDHPQQPLEERGHKRKRPGEDCDGLQHSKAGAKHGRLGGSEDAAVAAVAAVATAGRHRDDVGRPQGKGKHASGAAAGGHGGISSGQGKGHTGHGKGQQPAGADQVRGGQHHHQQDERFSRLSGRKPTALARLAEKVAQERQEQRRAHEEAQNAREARLQHIAAVEKQRKEEKQKFFKRNAKGQPLMRYRMEKLLAKIQG